jgi:hypothetical protein
MRADSGKMAASQIMGAAISACGGCDDTPHVHEHPKLPVGFMSVCEKEASAMVEIINLRQARKQRVRAEKEKKAAENRRSYGRTKAERQQSEQERIRAERELSGKQLDTPQPEDD